MRCRIRLCVGSQSLGAGWAQAGQKLAASARCGCVREGALAGHGLELRVTVPARPAVSDASTARPLRTAVTRAGSQGSQGEPTRVTGRRGLAKPHCRTHGTYST